MDRDEISLPVNVIEFADFHLQSFGPAHAEERIEDQHAHPEHDGALCDFAPDPAEADDAEGFVVELDSFK